MLIKSKILANVIDTGGDDVATSVAKKSRAIKLKQKLSKEYTAGLISGAGLYQSPGPSVNVATNTILATFGCNLVT